MNRPKFIVLIPCAGVGSRFGGAIPKQYSQINNKSVLEYTLEAFLAVSIIDQIVIIANILDEHIEFYKTISPRIVIHKVGGDTRSQSVLNGLSKLQCAPDDWVLVHDAVRCCVTPKLITSMITQLQKDDVGGIMAIPATDTLKSCINGTIIQTLNRSEIYLAQTPQMFRHAILYRALSMTISDQITDEASAVEQLGLTVRIVAGEASNFKLTYPLDLYVAKQWLSNHTFCTNGDV